MTKKIILVLTIIYLLVSCGKKGDPQYKDPKNSAGIQNIIINRV